MKNWIEISETWGKSVSRVNATNAPETTSPVDCLTISTKTFYLESACLSAKPLVKEGKIAICFQNCLGNEELAEEILGIRPANSLVNGWFSMAGPRKIEISWPGQAEFGERDGNNGIERIMILSEIFRKAKIPFVIQNDIRHSKWKNSSGTSASTMFAQLRERTAGNLSQTNLQGSLSQLLWKQSAWENPSEFNWRRKMRNQSFP